MFAKLEIAVAGHGFRPMAMPKSAAALETAAWLRDHLDRMGAGARKELAARLGHDRQDKITKMIAPAKPREPSNEELTIIEDFVGELAPFKKNRAGGARQTPVRIVGLVEAGGEERRINVGEEFLDTVPAPAGATKNTVAVEIRGDSLGELFDRWLAFYDDVRSPFTDDLLGRLCVVGIADGRVVIKKVRRGRTPGRYDLLSANAEPIRDVGIAWAARVKILTPRS